MSRISRRRFIKQATAGVAVTAAAVSGAGRVLGANERIRIGVAGIHGRGGSHIGSFAGMKDVEVAYLIDPDSSLFPSRSKQVEQKGGNAPECVQDVRRALEDKNLDAISIATCNHWHSLMTIWACQAGKDVYVEKPLSHNVHEGRFAAEAARKYNRIVQHGTQQRASDGRTNEIAVVHSGKYGKLLVSKGYCCKPRWSIGHKETEKAPASLDFDVWLGPAPEQPFHRNLVHYNWHWFWDFGNGDIGNQGVHEMDVALWAIKGATMPSRVWSLGGRFAYEDQGHTPNTQMAVFEYPHTEAKLVFEVRGLVGGKSRDSRKVANEYYTTEGMISGGRFYPKNGGEAERIPNLGVKAEPGGIFGNFINAVRSRDAKTLNAPVEVGHYSSAHCHLANVSYRLGKRVPFNQKTRAFGDDRVVHDTFKALENNLSKGVGLKLEGLTYQLGRTLEMDPKAEKFPGDDEANKLLTRPYRAPFLVPDRVV